MKSARRIVALALLAALVIAGDLHRAPAQWTGVFNPMMLPVNCTIQAGDSVPTMTSSTLPSGVVSSSSDFSAGVAGWKAFDKSTSTSWEAANATPPTWLQYQFSSAKTIAQYTIQLNSAGLALTNAPKDWTFKGSNDGTNFTTLDTQTGITTWVSLTVKTFTFTNTTAYLYYRLDITADNGGANPGVTEMQMMNCQ